MLYQIIIVIAALTIATVTVVTRMRRSKKLASNRLLKLSGHLKGLGVRASLLKNSDVQPRIETSDIWKYNSRSADILETSKF